MFNIFAAVLPVALQRFSENSDILTDLVNLQEHPVKIGLETAMECVRHGVWGMLYAHNAYIVSRSPQRLERIIIILDDVFGAFGLTVSEGKTETMS